MAKPKTPVTRPKPARPTAEKLGPFDEKRPDAPMSRVLMHARKLANQIRADLGNLTRAKITAADADRLEAAADTAEAAHGAWVAARKARRRGTVADARTPLREGRDQIFAALRTFAAADRGTQDVLDTIGGVDRDDGLANDTVRLLSLAKKHRADLDGTDLDAARLAEIKAALDRFAAARGGERAGATTAQAETEAHRTLRRERNRTFWALAAIDRQVCSFAQYGFRADARRRANYAFYRRNGARRAAEPAARAVSAAEPT